MVVVHRVVLSPVTGVGRVEAGRCGSQLAAVDLAGVGGAVWSGVKVTLFFIKTSSGLKEDM